MSSSRPSRLIAFIVAHVVGVLLGCETADGLVTMDAMAAMNAMEEIQS